MLQQPLGAQTEAAENPEVGKPREHPCAILALVPFVAVQAQSAVWPLSSRAGCRRHCGCAQAELKAKEEAAEKEKAEKAKAEAEAAEAKGGGKSLGQRVADLFDLPQVPCSCT